MADYWIFVSVPYTDYNVSTIHKMQEKIKSSRVWPIGKRTAHRKQLSEGDKVLFYQGGERGRKIVGSAELESSLIIDEEGIYDFVMIKNFELWDRPVELKRVLNGLSFVRYKKYWSAYFQGGIAKISEKDFEYICAKRL